MYKNLLEILKIISRRDITKLFKDYLASLEDLKNSRQECRDKLEQVIPEQYQLMIDACFPFSPNEMGNMRKRILDLGNEAIRNQIELIEKIELMLDKNSIKQDN